MRIYLIGYMGSGKTTVGKRLARTLSYKFLDLDFLFEEQFKISVSEFFEKYDEDAFRRIESDLVQKSMRFSNIVIATGGGSPCFFNNMEMMNESGVTIYLKMSPKALKNRLISAKRSRPLIANIPEDELEAFIEQKLEKRSPYYEKAKLIVNGLDCDIDEIAELIYMNSSL